MHFDIAHKTSVMTTAAGDTYKVLLTCVEVPFVLFSFSKQRRQLVYSFRVDSDLCR